MESFQSNAEKLFQGIQEYRSSGLKKSLHGNVYQLKLLMLFLKRGIDKGYSFLLATEMDDAEKFDDIVFKYRNEKILPQGEKYRFLQAKHKYDESEKISKQDLLNENDGDFSLIKYFISYRCIKKKFTDGHLQDLTICTNIGFDGELERHLVKIGDIDDILDKNNEIVGKKGTARFKFKRNSDWVKKVLCPLLEQKSDLNNLAEKLAKDILSEKKLELRHIPYKNYHVALIKEIINPKTGKFQKNFIGSKNLSSQAEKFKKIFFEKASKINQLNEQNKIINFDWETLFNLEIKMSKPFGDDTEDPLQKLPDDIVPKEDINEFIEKFVFAVNQPNEIELGKYISAELSDDFNLIDGDFIACKFQVEMLGWLKKKRGTFLCAEDGKAFFDEAQQKLDRLILIGPTLEYRAKLKKSGISFKETVELGSFLTSASQVFNLVSKSTRIGFIKIQQYLQHNIDYKKDDSYFFTKLTSAVSLQSRLVKAFGSTTNSQLLIIECNGIENEDEKKLFELLSCVLNHKPSKKIILITQDKDTIANLFDRKNNDYVQEIDDKDNNFRALNEESQNYIKKKILYFQNKEIAMDKLVRDTGFEEIITAEALLELVDRDKIVIDHALPNFNKCEETCYIDRKLIHSAKIKTNYLLKYYSDDLFAINGATEEKLCKLGFKMEEIHLFSENDSHKNNLPYPFRFVLLTDVDVTNQFRKLTEVYSKLNIHWLTFEENQLFWKQSYGSSLFNLREYFSKYQMDELTDRIIIITAESGMGKSTLLTHLSEHIKKVNPYHWVIRINLIDLRDQLSDIDFKRIDDVIDFLATANHLQVLAKNLLSHYFKYKYEITLMLDGFDEISQKLQTKVINLLEILKLNTESIIIVSARLDSKEKLEDSLAVFSYTLKPFSKEEGIFFLKSFFIKSLNTSDVDDNLKKSSENYAKILLKLFSESAYDKKHEFLGIPLQIKLLGESFKNDFFTFYHSNEISPQLPKTLNVLDLFQCFINSKYSIFFKEKNFIDINNVLSGIKNSLIRSLTKDHRRLAFDLLFPIDAIFIWNNMQTIFATDELKLVGIVQFIDGKLDFVHRTFAEYFVADLLADVLMKGKEHSKYKSIGLFFIKQIFQDQMQVIRNFLAYKIFQRSNFDDIHQENKRKLDNLEDIYDTISRIRTQVFDDIYDYPQEIIKTLSAAVECYARHRCKDIKIIFVTDIIEMPALQSICDIVHKKCNKICWTDKSNYNSKNFWVGDNEYTCKDCFDQDGNQPSQIVSDIVSTLIEINDQIEIIELCRLCINDEGVESICNSIKENSINKLICLNLYKNNVTYNGVEHIYGMLKTCFIKKLFLGYNKINDLGAKWIAKIILFTNPGIECIDIFGSAITRKGLEIISAARYFINCRLANIITDEQDSTGLPPINDENGLPYIPPNSNQIILMLAIEEAQIDFIKDFQIKQPNDIKKEISWFDEEDEHFILTPLEYARKLQPEIFKILVQRIKNEPFSQAGLMNIRGLYRLQSVPKLTNPSEIFYVPSP